MSTLYESAPAGNPAVEPIDMARAYVSAITGSADTPMHWRACHDTDKGAPAKSFFGTVDHLWRELFEMNMRGYGIFAVVSALDGNGRKLENVTSIRAHFIDLDKGSVEANAARAAASHPAPCFKVNSSPGKVHVYWCVEAYSGNDRFQTLQRKLVQTYDSDPQVIDATRLMRVPGSWHMKGDVPHPVTCELLPGYTNPRTTIEAMEAAYAHVQVIHGGAGERHELGEPELAAPSLEWLTHALALVDPNDLDRLEWISLTAAVKQAGWTLTDPDSLYAMWLGWCARYANDNPAENAKNWHSIRNTELGWHSLVRRVPSLKASMAFGVNGEGVPTAPPMPGQMPSTARNFGEILDASEQAAYFQDYTWVTDLGRIIAKNGTAYTREKFNAALGGKRFIIDQTGRLTDDAWKAATCSTLWTIPKVEGTRFLPHLAPGTIITDELGRT
ncbi:DNA-primase RepB domain-containing protein, partial [Novosphingobium sp. HII-3]|uniref:DNA-primase RepB domain-containing protein n=1 Tax=Novosphingobium sp. HII-3 TaxID=2075565 RepID=UPI0018EB86D6